jgi:predicted unusual protein kinase regulating ubiquinone biosynthesis (AarF/ABC1/UbiB family)
MSLSKGRCVHADPHPGNILVSNNHTGLVDFGSVKKDLPKDVVELFLLLCNSAADTNRIVELYESLGAKVTNGKNDFYAKHVETYHKLCSSLVGMESVGFSAKRETVAKMRRTLFTQSTESTLQNFSSEFTILHKSFQSLLFLLCKYQATINTEVEGINSAT